MSNRLREREEKILELLEELALEAAKGTPIIVEGARDIQTLSQLSVEGRIIPVKTGGKSFVDAVLEVEGTKAQEVILLLDFDRKGKEVTQKLVVWLERTRVKPNLDFWRKLRALVGREVKDIEGLASYLQTLRRKIGVS